MWCFGVLLWRRRSSVSESMKQNQLDHTQHSIREFSILRRKCNLGSWVLPRAEHAGRPWRSFSTSYHSACTISWKAFTRNFTVTLDLTVFALWAFWNVFVLKTRRYKVYFSHFMYKERKKGQSDTFCKYVLCTNLIFQSMDDWILFSWMIVCF